MTLVPLKVPPGAYRVGTEYEAKGRWWDTNLVRWQNGSLRPIGGWTQWGADTFSGVARGIYVWTDNSGNRWVAFGTSSKLYVANSSGTITDITPASGFTAGAEDATLNIGYGTSTYGSHNYGTARPDTGSVTRASTWALDGWGQYLVGVMDGDGDVWEWQLNTANDAAQVSNAPTGCIGLVVTQERFLFALGAGGDPRKVAWCDQGANTTWTAAATNQAGSFILETDGQIRCGIKQANETLILTSTDLWAARYIGQPLVYSFRRVDTGCGTPSCRAAVNIGGKAVWLGHGGFFMYDGYVRRLRCDVWDLYQERIAKIQASKIFGWHNTDHHEAVWLIPSATSDECDFYITWNYAEDWWSFCEVGAFERSCGIGRGTFQNPVLCGTDGKLYSHEIGIDHGDETPYAETGPLELGDGERWVHARMLYPDEETLAQTTLSFKTRQYPTATETTHGPYTMENPTSVRFSGRQARMRVASSGDTDWRFGVPRLDVVSGGKR
jgi:hypothetical protein